MSDEYTALQLARLDAWLQHVPGRGAFLDAGPTEDAVDLYDASLHYGGKARKAPGSLMRALQQALDNAEAKVEEAYRP